MNVSILIGDCREKLRELPDESVHCCVTSPPYWGLRDYGVDGQLGLEISPSEYIDGMVAVFRELHRVLRSDGTLWLNLGDCYATSPPGNKPGWEGLKNSGLAGVREGSPYLDTLDVYMKGQRTKREYNLKTKDLCGIPWRVAFALQADGWYLRQDIIWHKPNPMPESIRDRCTKAHEYIFLLSKNSRYYYDSDAIREYAKYGIDQGTGRNKRSVWTVSPKPFKEAHFATFPPDLIEPCILAGTSEKGCCSACGAPYRRHTERIDQGYDGSEYGRRALEATGGAISGGIAKSTLGSGNGTLVGGRETTGWSVSCLCEAEVIPCTVLDPFAGAGTTGLVADKHGRDAILIELNPDYAIMAERRISAEVNVTKWENRL